MDGLDGLTVAGGGSLSSDAKSGLDPSMIRLFGKLQEGQDRSNELMVSLASLVERLLGGEVQEDSPETQSPLTGPSIMDALHDGCSNVNSNLTACHRSYDRINTEVGSRP